MMNVQITLFDIVNLPRKLQMVDKSIYTLLKETKYAEIKDHISVDTIRIFLSEKPEYVSDWMQYSENKRTAGGWYIKEVCHGEFVVGCLETGEQVSYNEALYACAFFMKRELESIL